MIIDTHEINKLLVSNIIRYRIHKETHGAIKQQNYNNYAMVYQALITCP